MIDQVHTTIGPLISLSETKQTHVNVNVAIMTSSAQPVELEASAASGEIIKPRYQIGHL